MRFKRVILRAAYEIAFEQAVKVVDVFDGHGVIVRDDIVTGNVEWPMRFDVEMPKSMWFGALFRIKLNSPSKFFESRMVIAMGRIPNIDGKMLPIIDKMIGIFI